jgi:DNA replication and repair protein RecF
MMSSNQRFKYATPIHLPESRTVPMLKSWQVMSITFQRSPIYISHLSLLNFRNYERLELDLKPGMVLFQGENGQGKSNLLEAIYLLSIAKSPRASADRELVRRQSMDGEAYSRVAAVVQREGDPLRVQIDFRSTPTEAEEDEDAPRRAGETAVQKYFRVNGVPRRAAVMVGQLNTVMFSAEDLELVYGSPTVRRRYLDILISQVDHQYLRALQRYQRVVYQRNHLLRMVKEGHSRRDELGFWDDELVREGTFIMLQRLLTVKKLSEVAGPIHQQLSGPSTGSGQAPSTGPDTPITIGVGIPMRRDSGQGETLEMVYQPNVAIGDDEAGEAVAQDFREAMEARRQRELAQGVTVSGPHRDDLQMLIDGMDVGTYASRGQARTVVLAMKLAEASYLKAHRHQEPILLLDDVLSELDAVRRAHVLNTASQYQQSFITTADVDAIEERFLSRMARFVVRRGQVEAIASGNALSGREGPALNDIWDNDEDSAYDSP